MGHIHAAAMAEYAKDAAETDTPWERWEFSFVGQEKYFVLESDPCWATGTKYRRKAKTTLLYDIDRCPGVPNEPDEPPGWREGCETCLRRTAPGSPHRQAWMEPPAIIGFFCEYLIEPGGHETLPPENVTRQ